MDLELRRLTHDAITRLTAELVLSKIHTIGALVPGPGPGRLRMNEAAFVGEVSSWLG